MPILPSLTAQPRTKYRFFALPRWRVLSDKCFCPRTFFRRSPSRQRTFFRLLRYGNFFDVKNVFSAADVFLGIGRFSQQRTSFRTVWRFFHNRDFHVCSALLWEVEWPVIERFRQPIRTFGDLFTRHAEVDEINKILSQFWCFFCMTLASLGTFGVNLLVARYFILLWVANIH